MGVVYWSHHATTTDHAIRTSRGALLRVAPDDVETRMTIAPTPDIERRTLSVNGLQFEALATGPVTGELVLCLHGFPEFADAWIPTLRLLAEAGYRAVAVNQRGYSPAARPPHVHDYAIRQLVSDVLGFADQLGTEAFHLVGHDWGGIVAWAVGAARAQRLLSLCVVSTPHPDALRAALATDGDQKRRSWYIALLKLPKPIPEWLLLAANARALRGAYKRKVPREQVLENVRRLREPGALTAALNWYRALTLKTTIGPVAAPTLFIWGSNDQALGRYAAMSTAQYVTGPYQFEMLDGASHWLLAEHPSTIARSLIRHLRRFGREIDPLRAAQGDNA